MVQVTRDAVVLEMILMWRYTYMHGSPHDDESGPCIIRIIFTAFNVRGPKYLL